MAQEIVEIPIGGKVTSVVAKAGDKVEEGDTLCLLEAMKMENPILAPVAGGGGSRGRFPGPGGKKRETIGIL